MRTIKEIAGIYSPILNDSVDKIDEETLQKITNLFFPEKYNKTTERKIVEVSNLIRSHYPNKIYQLEVIGSLMTIAQESTLDITSIPTPDLRFFSDYALNYNADSYQELINLFGESRFLAKVTSFDNDDMKRVALMDFFYDIADGVVSDWHNEKEISAFREYSESLIDRVSHDSLLGYTNYAETMDDIADITWGGK